jgi:mannose-1-phosphate guanylyltransferase
VVLSILLAPDLSNGFWERGIVKVMILAAGLGTRLRPLTEACPKPLLPLVLQPILTHVLAQLQEQGVQDVIINLHHQATQMRQWLENHRQWGLRLHLSYEPVILGTAGGIKRVEALLRDAPFAVINADVLVDLDLKSVWRWHCQRGAMVTMVVRPDAAARTYGPVLVDATDQVLRINDRPCVKASGTGQEMVFTGMQIVSPEVLQWIAPERSLSTTADIYPALIAQHQAVYGYRHAGYWMDVGVPERYRQAHWDMLNGALGMQWQQRLPPGSRVVLQAATPRASAYEPTIVPPVVMGRGVELAPGVRLGPYAVLGSGCQIGAGAMIRETVLGEAVRVAPEARLYRCILGTGVHVDTPGLLRDVVWSA